MHIPRRRKFRAAIAAGSLVLMGIIACSSHQLIDSSGGGGGGRSTGACAPGVQGCPCDTGGQTVACGHVVNRFSNYVTCSEGMSTCQSGVWSACQGDTIYTKSIVGLRIGSGGLHIESSSAPCTDMCNPNTCTQTTDGPADVDASGIESGIVKTEGGISLGSGGSGGGGDASSDAASDAGATDSGATCNCQVSLCDGGNGTTITGRVFDPAGNNPLYNAWVYIPLNPSAPLPAFTQGVSCEKCGTSLLQTRSVAVTATDGTFTLTHVPDGTNVPIVVQMGKWRRKITLPSVTACTNNPIADGVLHLPRNRTDGDGNTADIPQMAFVSGKADPFECMLLKMGIDPNEFGSLTKNPNRRIHYYDSPERPDLSIDPSFGNVITGDTMWNSPTNLALYDIVVLACESAPQNNPNRNTVVSGATTGYQNVTNWAGNGGRAFMSHYSYVWLRYNAPWVAIPASWIGTIKTQDPMTGDIVTAGFPKGQALSDWLYNVGGSTIGADGGMIKGKIDLYQAHQSSNRPLSANAQEWVTATDSNGGSPPLYSPDFVFNTPVGAAPASQCGRVTYSDVHVGAQDLLNPDASGNVSCLANTDCGYGSTGCVGAVPGGCSAPPGGGWCYDATDCTGAGGSGTCTGSTLPKCTKNTACTLNSQCKSNSCNVGTGNCNTPPFCNPNTAGSCGTSEKCTGGTKGKCGCWQNSYCKTTNSSGSSWGNYCNTPSPTNGICNGNGNKFPYGCAQGLLDSQEDLLEFHIFDLSSCISPDNAPPPAPPVPVVTLTPATFTVDFSSNCPSGTHVAWRELDWQATVPNTSSIVFKAQTADAPDGGSANYGGAQLVPLATATTTTASLPTGWDAVLIDVAGSGKFNSASPVVASKNSLRLTITLNPTADMMTSPTLIQWKVKADCPASE